MRVTGVSRSVGSVVGGEFRSVLENVVLDEDAACAARLRESLTNAIASMFREGFNHSDAMRIRWQNATAKYRERWAQGDLEGILPVLSDLLGWLREAGVDMARNADVIALLDDPSFSRLRSRETRLLNVFRQFAGSESAGLTPR